MNNYHIETLPNGLTVILRPYPDRQGVYANLTVAAGPRYETSRTAGFSHLAEHVLLRKTMSHLSGNGRRMPEVIEEAIGNTHKERTEYSLLVSAEEIPAILAQFRELLSSRGILADDVEIESQVIRSELLEEEADPGLGYEREIDRALYGWEPQPVRPVSKQALTRFIDQQYRPGRAQLTLTGAIPANIMSLLRRTFGKIPRKTGAAKKMNPIAWRTTARDRLRRIQRSKTTVTFIGCFWRARVRNAKKAVQIDLLERLLLNYLHNTLRDRGMAYSVEVRSMIHADFADVGIEALVNPEISGKFLPVLRKGLKRFRRDLTEPVYRVQQRNQVRRLLVQADDLEAEGHSLGWHHFTFGSPLSLEEQIKVYQETSLQELRKLYSETFARGKDRTVIIGPNQD